MWLLSCGTCSYLLLLPFLTPIFEVISSYLRGAAKPSELIQKQHFILDQLLMCIGESLNVIFMLIISLRGGRKSKTDLNEEVYVKPYNNNIMPLKLPPPPEPPSSSYRLIFLSTLLDVTSALIKDSIVIYLIETKPEKTESITTIKFKVAMVQLIAIAGFGSIKSTKYFYKHRIVSIVLTLLGLSLFCISEFNYQALLFIIPYVISGAQYALMEDLIYIDQKESPYTFITLQGVFGIIICLFMLWIIEVIAVVFNNNKFMLYDELASLWLLLSSWWYSLQVIFNLMLYNLCIVLTISYYGATMMCICSFFSPLYNTVLELIIGTLPQMKRPNYAFEVPGYLMTFIGCMIYSEVVIFNFCGLEYNTKSQISNRSKEDYLDLTFNKLM